LGLSNPLRSDLAPGELCPLFPLVAPGGGAEESVMTLLWSFVLESVWRLRGINRKITPWLTTVHTHLAREGLHLQGPGHGHEWHKSQGQESELPSITKSNSEANPWSVAEKILNINKIFRDLCKSPAKDQAQLLTMLQQMHPSNRPTHRTHTLNSDASSDPRCPLNFGGVLGQSCGQSSSAVEVVVEISHFLSEHGFEPAPPQPQGQLGARLGEAGRLWLVERSVTSALGRSFNTFLAIYAEAKVTFSKHGSQCYMMGGKLRSDVELT